MDSLLGFTGDLFLGSDAMGPSFTAVAKGLGPQVSLVVNFEEGAELAVEQGDAATERYGEVASTVARNVDQVSELNE